METPRRFIIAIITLRGVYAKLNFNIVVHMAIFRRIIKVLTVVTEKRTSRAFITIFLRHIIYPNIDSR